MATWMTHIRIADELMKKYPRLYSKEFVIGSIAPDCGKINPDGVSYVPENDITHFGRYREGRDYGRLISLMNKDNARFFLGYYTHILTDDIWIANVLLPKKAVFLPEFEDFYHFIMAQRENWFILDREYIRDHPDNEAYRLFEETEEMENIYLDFQPSDALTGHIEKVKAQYASPIPEDYDKKYMSEDELSRFIEIALPQIYVKLGKLERSLLG